MPVTQWPGHTLCIFHVLLIFLEQFVFLSSSVLCPSCPSFPPSCLAPSTPSFIRLLCWLLQWSNHIRCRAHIKMHSRRLQLLILAENRSLVRSAPLLQQLCCLSAAMDAARRPPGLLYSTAAGLAWSTATNCVCMRRGCSMYVHALRLPGLCFFCVCCVERVSENSLSLFSCLLMNYKSMILWKSQSLRIWIVQVSGWNISNSLRWILVYICAVLSKCASVLSHFYLPTDFVCDCLRSILHFTLLFKTWELRKGSEEVA